MYSFFQYILQEYARKQSNTCFFFPSAISTSPNTTNNSTSALAISNGFPLNIQIGVTVLAVSVSILAMIGNALVVYIVCTVNHMRSSTNTLIANMAIADLLMAIDIPYIIKWLFVSDTWFGTFMGTVLCKFFHSAQIGSLAASVFSLVAISLDRSFAILFPMKTIMTRNVVRFSIAMVWLCALTLSLPLMIASKNVQLEGTEIMICREFWDPMSRSTYSLVFFVTGYFIPLIIIAVVYCLAGLRLWSRKLPGNTNLAAEKRAQATSRRATAMLITVVIVFVSSWLPLQAYEMMHRYNPPLVKKIPLEFLLFMPWFGITNSAINPILYVIFSENYRQEFYRILCRGPSRKDRYKRAIIRSVDADIGNTRTTLGQSRESPLAVHISLTRKSRRSASAVNTLSIPKSCGSTADIPLTTESRVSPLAVDTSLTSESRVSPLAVNIPITSESLESLLATNIPLTRQFHGSSLAVDIPLTCESRGSLMTVEALLTCESRRSTLAVDKPSIPKNCGSSVAIPFTRESRGSPLAVDTSLTSESRVSSLSVDIPLSRESRVSSLTVDIPITTESRLSSLAVDTLLTRESRVSPLTADIPITSESLASSLATNIPLTPQSRESSLAADEVEDTRL